MRRFRLWKTIYVSTKEVVFLIVVKVEEDDFIKKEITANIRFRGDNISLWQKDIDRIKNGIVF